ncbi:helix-turn-helix domain-containing protein [Nesterenkonia sandarakina]|uniref:helix-turn-helix domain-containing protein n=1 Tax=Nesterenkonia sandarakina TaxID=272918 RepID=UPI000D06202E|nr:helix-turn-helix domain-containing protein [Nesterenkonia sandarakina]
MRVNDPRLIDDLLEGFPDLATPQEVGDLLRVGIVTINKWMRSGHIPSIRAGLRVNRIPKKELREFLLNADEMKDPDAETKDEDKEKDSA